MADYGIAGWLFHICSDRVALSATRFDITDLAFGSRLMTRISRCARRCFTLEHALLQQHRSPTLGLCILIASLNDHDPTGLDFSVHGGLCIQPIEEFARNTTPQMAVQSRQTAG